MKKVNTICLLLLFALVGCGGGQQATDALITVDVTKSYPKKELILQDFMEVEYIALETNDEFITQGIVMAIGHKMIVAKNRINDGNIFIFDRITGKGIRKINRMGQSGEEYTFINAIVLDENNNELFVNCASMNKILVYDLYGNFKRSFGHTADTQYLEIFNYDADNLIRYDISGYYKDGESRGDQSFHAIISKQDGSVTQDIPIPFTTIKAPTVRQGDGFAVSTIPSIIPYYGNWLLVETSSDTIYNYLPKENRLVPFMARTPSVHSMDPAAILTMGTLTDRYYFLRIFTITFDFTKGRGFPMTEFMYDK